MRNTRITIFLLLFFLILTACRDVGSNDAGSSSESPALDTKVDKIIA